MHAKGNSCVFVCVPQADWGSLADKSMLEEGQLGNLGLQVDPDHA